MKIFRTTLILVLLLLPHTGFAQQVTEDTTPRLWILKTLDGDSINLGERIREPDNKIMVFWSTWCPYCKQLMPIVAQIKRDYPKLEVLSFNVFDDLDPKNYPQQANWPFTHLLNGDEFARVHGVQGLPTLFLVNDKGKMVLDLREIDTSSVISPEMKSNSAKARSSAPLWNAGLRKALDDLTWTP